MAKRAASCVRGEGQKKIANLIESLTGRYNGWEVWQDFIYMSAISIANVFPGAFRDLREKMYLERAQRYSKDELGVFAKMLAEVVNAMEENPDQDFLGSLFMALGLGDQWKGQFFTPYSVCRCMADIEIEDVHRQLNEHPFVTCNDPACGAGALLIAYANACRSVGINYQNDALFVAQDLDLLAGMMCYIQLSLLGCAGYVVIGDTLSSPGLALDDRGLIPLEGSNIWYTPMYYSGLWRSRQMIAKAKLYERRPEREQDHV